MKKTKILIRTLALALTLLSAAVFGGIIYADNTLSKNYYLVEGTQFKVNCQVPITVEWRRRPSGHGCTPPSAADPGRHR